MSDLLLSGLTVALFESRFGTEFAGLVHKQGGHTLSAPTIVEAPIELGTELREFFQALQNGKIDAMLVLTGVGHRKLVELLAPLATRDELRALLERTMLCARGPKSVGALKETGLKAQVTAPEPHTWQDLLGALEQRLPPSGKLIALQQYGVPHQRLTEALTSRGAQVMQVPVYRWRLPDDISPIERNIDALCEGQVDIVLFTSGPQVGALLEVAKRMGKEQALRAALGRVAIGSVGPSCTEAMGNLELTPDFEPEHGKMAHLVREAARTSRDVLARKRAS
jgi:uroporphyrinogen-III synthase